MPSSLLWLLLTSHLSVLSIHGARILKTDDKSSELNRAKSHRHRREDTKCLTTSGPVSNVDCDFPFTYKEQVFNGCTLRDSETGTPWCYTKTTNDEGNWGYCDKSCPFDFASDCAKFPELLNADIATKIINGTPALSFEFPWFVALLDRTSNNELDLSSSSSSSSSFCGGSLVTERHVLTAAHCVSSYFLSKKKENLRLRIDGDLYGVSELVLHHDYYNLVNDIALLRMDRPVELHRSVRPICLPADSRSYSDEEATVIGNGKTSVDGDQSPILLKAAVNIWENAKCKENYASKEIEIKETMICANGDGTDSCQGDSGGPLICRNEDMRQWELCGIVSFGIQGSCYAKVSEYTDWTKGWIWPRVESIVAGECPSTHPYAFSGGHLCCSTNKDCKGDKDDEEDDQTFSSSSECCSGDDVKTCPQDVCEDNDDLETTTVGDDSDTTTTEGG